MTAPLSATVANLRRLRDEATPGPWTQENPNNEFWPEDERSEPGPAIYAGGHQLIYNEGGHTTADAALIVSAVNALPTLLDAVEERDRLREEAAKWRAAWAQTSGEHDNPWEGYERTADAIRAPLSRR